MSSSPLTAVDVACWMVEQLREQRYLYQETVVYEIAEKFGSEFVYDNANGNLAIGKRVLAEFRKLTEHDVVWERGDRMWRYREAYDAPGRQSD